MEFLASGQIFIVFFVSSFFGITADFVTDLPWKVVTSDLLLVSITLEATMLQLQGTALWLRRLAVFCHVAQGASRYAREDSTLPLSDGGVSNCARFCTQCIFAVWRVVVLLDCSTLIYLVAVLISNARPGLLAQTC